jgi:serine-type D-Ala-D-Ala carboxypeptidase/endopeptidase (penicillin-binding protein 4)
VVGNRCLWRGKPDTRRRRRHAPRSRKWARGYRVERQRVRRDGDLADAIVTALAAEGVTRVDIVVDDHVFGGLTLPPDWDSDAISEGYCAAPSGLAVNEAIIPNDDPEAEPERYPDPSLNAGDFLAERLEERGISVGTVTRGVAQPGETELAFVESAPLEDIVAFMVWYSDNTLAELLLKLLALEGGLPGTTKAGTAEALRVLAAYGLDTTGVTLTDGSGYSTTNRIPARFLTDLIVALARDPQMDDLLEQLPVAALRGTLFDRFGGTSGAGVVRAKTGSLGGVTSLSGTVVTADGRWLAFSVLADGLPWGQTKPREAIDEFVSALASCGCG